MLQLHEFSGGIHPPENKHQSSHHPLRQAGLPDVLILPLQQHIGEPARVRVQVGDTVHKGECLADAVGPVSSPVHAPTSGTVIAVATHPVPHPSGMEDWCITLRPDGHDQWIEHTPSADYHKQSREAVLDQLREMGIVGLGGAGFPASIKLRPPRQDKVSTLILNGAECEPYITADDRLMREKAGEVIAGMEIMAWILRPQRCVIAIEDNKPEAIEAIRAAARETQIEVAVIPTKYPSGGEKQLVWILTGQEVPHGGLPADIGVMCQNVGTAVAVSRAIHQGEPLISRVTTVTGNAVTRPGNYETLIGTPVSHLLSLAGLQEDQLERLVLGGPMMGFTLASTHIPVVKTTNCVVAAGVGELPEPPPEQPCIRCGACAEACPMELLPQQLFWYSKSEELDKAEHLNLFDCIECGACSYVCPSSIPLVQYYRFAKGAIRTQRAEQLKSDLARVRFEARQARLEREQAEKEARRQERARAAAAKKAEPGPKAESSPNDDKKQARAAMVEEALSRKKQAAEASGKAPAPPVAAEQPDIDTLTKQRDQAREKLATMTAMLEEARASGADNVDKLERAVGKNQDRVRRAEEALDAASSQAPETTTQSEPDS